MTSNDDNSPVQIQARDQNRTKKEDGSPSAGGPEGRSPDLAVPVKTQGHATDASPPPPTTARKTVSVKDDDEATVSDKEDDGAANGDTTATTISTGVPPTMNPCDTALDATTLASASPRASAAAKSSASPSSLGGFGNVPQGEAKVIKENIVMVNGQELYIPTEHDVLLGRGKPFQCHAGNIRFHDLVDSLRPRYVNAKRYDKLAISTQIVKTIKFSGEYRGRFLQRVEGTNKWEEVPDQVAREKASHALRGKPRKEEFRNSAVRNIKNGNTPGIITKKSPSGGGTHQMPRMNMNMNMPGGGMPGGMSPMNAMLPAPGMGFAGGNGGAQQHHQEQQPPPPHQQRQRQSHEQQQHSDNNDRKRPATSDDPVLGDGSAGKRQRFEGPPNGMGAGPNVPGGMPPNMNMNMGMNMNMNDFHLQHQQQNQHQHQQQNQQRFHPQMNFPGGPPHTGPNYGNMPGFSPSQQQMMPQDMMQQLGSIPQTGLLSAATPLLAASAARNGIFPGSSGQQGNGGGSSAGANGGQGGLAALSEASSSAQPLLTEALMRRRDMDTTAAHMLARQHLLESMLQRERAEQILRDVQGGYPKF